MNDIRVGIQVESLGQRCGIYTYARRLKRALDNKNIENELFVTKPTKEVDIVNLQYEPGLFAGNQGRMQQIMQKNLVPVIATVHHINGLPMLYNHMSGFILHDKNQIPDEIGMPMPPNYTIIPHPAVYYEKKDKEKLRDKFSLPQDKKIIGTMGFIFGTGKEVSLTVDEILKKLNDDEFLYVSTSTFKDSMASSQERQKIERAAKKSGKEDQIRIDTDFVDEEILNERMQACDLLYSWNVTSPGDFGSNSGIAADMYASHTKTIFKDTPHYRYITRLDGVETARQPVRNMRVDVRNFANDVVTLLRDDERLQDIPDGEWLSWDNQVEKYIDYYKDFLL